MLATVSFWFVIQSRIAFPGMASILMALLAMWLLVVAVQSRSRSRGKWLAVASGVALGLGIYTFKTFLLYFIGFWGAALLAAILYRELRQGWEVWLCLGVSAAVGSPVLLFYATSGYIGTNLNDLYQVSLASPSTWLEIPGNAVHALLLVSQPVQGNTIDGAPGMPVLPTVASVFFWAGLAVTLLLVRQRRYQLLLAGWAIGMAPVLIVPGAESRRYLLGIFFVLVTASIGFDVVLGLLEGRMRGFLRDWNLSAAGVRYAAAAVGLAAAVAFAGLFTVQNQREVGRWGDSPAVRWYFNYEYHQAILFLKDLNVDLPIRMYTVRQQFESSIRRFELPGARGHNGSELFGGDGTIPPRADITEATLFVLLDKYLPLADALESEYDGEVRIGHRTEMGETLFVAYLVPAQGE